jgi:hypothetical protein
MFTLMYKTAMCTLTVIGTVMLFVIGTDFASDLLTSNPNLIP